jgi:hypothetical protein
MCKILPDSILKFQADEEDWRSEFIEKLHGYLDILENHIEPGSMLDDITKIIFNNKSQLLSDVTLGFIKKEHRCLLQQEYCECPRCSRQLKARGLSKRDVETLVGNFSLWRPYFYCEHCRVGFHPLDEALGLAKSAKQYDIQDVEAWLSSELPFETASEAFERCTGNQASAHHMHEATNNIARGLSILDVCPSKEEIESEIEELSKGKFRRPVMMLALDGAHTPVRPEPSPRSGERGAGAWKESKGFRLYLIDSERIIHLISWHQVQTDRELAQSLVAIKEAGLIPEEKIRLCAIGDGADWIWNRLKEIFPTIKEVLDYYHCSEYIHALANIHYGKGTRKAQEWVESTLTRLFHNRVDDVISGIKRMKPGNTEAEEKIEDVLRYLTKHRRRLDYGAARRGGYHIGSGAIESANKFIGHVRLKRSGAWWYPSNANNILKLRCAKYNGTYDKIIAEYKVNDRQKRRV